MQILIKYCALLLLICPLLVYFACLQTPNLRAVKERLFLPDNSQAPKEVGRDRVKGAGNCTKGATSHALRQERSPWGWVINISVYRENTGKLKEVMSDGLSYPWSGKRQSEWYSSPLILHCSPRTNWARRAGLLIPSLSDPEWCPSKYNWDPQAWHFVCMRNSLF